MTPGKSYKIRKNYLWIVTYFIGLKKVQARYILKPSNPSHISTQIPRQMSLQVHKNSKYTSLSYEKIHLHDDLYEHVCSNERIKIHVCLNERMSLKIHVCSNERINL